MKAAARWGRRPTEYLGTSEPGEKWSSRDRGLAEGFILYEQGIGPHGIPLRLALDPETEDEYEVDDELVNYAVVAFEEWQKDHPDPLPGTVPRVLYRPHPVR
jgi:hypothetical protein